MVKDKFAKLMYYIFIGTLLFIGLLTGKIKASTISYDYSKYYVRTTDYPFSNTDNTWSSALNLGDFYNTTDIGYVNSIRTRFGINAKFSANTKYRVKINVKFNNDSDKSIYLDANSVICQGSATSTWSSDENLIDSCRFVARTFYNDNKNASYLFDIIPNTSVYGIQIAFYIKGSQYPYWSGDRIQAIRVLASSNITTDTSTSDTINNSTTEIIYNNNKNTQDIINNQNEMLGSKCENLLDNSNANIKNGWISGTTMRINSDNGNRMIFLKVDSGQTYTISRDIITSSFRVSSYNSIPTMTTSNVDYSVQSTNENNNGNKITYTPQNKYLVIHYGNVGVDGQNLIDKSLNSIMVVKGSNSKPYCEYGSYQSKLDETNNAINGLNDTMNNSSVDDPSGDFNQFENKVASNGVITQLITLPITFYTKVLNNLNGSCQAMDLGSLYGNNLTMPCVNIGSFLGNTLWTLIDLIMSGMFVWFIAKRFIQVFNNFSSMKEGDVVGD